MEHPIRSRIVVSARQEWKDLERSDYNLLRTERHSLLCLANKQIRGEMLALAETYLRTIILKYIGFPNLISQLEVFRVKRRKAFRQQYFVVKYVPKVHYDRSIVWQTFLLSDDGIDALVEVCKDCPGLETITLQWTLRDTKTNWKKVYVDINCLDVGKKLVFPAVQDTNRRMPQWEATLRKELGPDYVK